MGTLRDFVADLLEYEGAAIERVTPVHCMCWHPNLCVTLWVGRSLCGSALGRRLPQASRRSGSKATGSSALPACSAIAVASPSGSSWCPTTSRHPTTRNVSSTVRSSCPMPSGGFATPDRPGPAAYCSPSATLPCPTSSARECYGSVSTVGLAPYCTRALCSDCAPIWRTQVIGKPPTHTFADWRVNHGTSRRSRRGRVR